MLTVVHGILVTGPSRTTTDRDTTHISPFSSSLNTLSHYHPILRYLTKLKFKLFLSFLACQVSASTLSIMTGPSVTLPTFSEFAGGVRLTLTWPGRAIKEAGSMLLRNSKTCRFPPLAFLPGCLMTGTGVVTEAAGDATSNLVIGAASLISWAVGGHEPIPEQMNPEFIDKERQQEGFEADRIHVAVCGHTGSGKSSVINALRGIHNSHGEAAPVGTSETTISRGTYYAHRSMPLITLHDIPGAGTRRTPLDNYYDNQKLYLFDLLLVVHSERVGTVS